jgi:hypothetical protein
MNIIEAETVCPPKTKPKNLSHFAIGGTGIRTPPITGPGVGAFDFKSNLLRAGRTGGKAVARRGH